MAGSCEQCGQNKTFKGGAMFVHHNAVFVYHHSGPKEPDLTHSKRRALISLKIGTSIIEWSLGGLHGPKIPPSLNNLTLETELPAQRSVGINHILCIKYVYIAQLVSGYFSSPTTPHSSMLCFWFPFRWVTESLMTVEPWYLDIIHLCNSRILTNG